MLSCQGQITRVVLKNIRHADFVQKCTSITATNDGRKVLTRQEVDVFFNGYHEHKFEPRITHGSLTSPKPASRKEKSKKKKAQNYKEVQERPFKKVLKK